MKKKQKLIDLKRFGFVVDNHWRRGFTKAKRMYIRKSVAEALVKARDLLPSGFNFKIWDGARSLSQQRTIIKICEKQLKKEHPKNWLELLNRYTGGYKSLTQELPLDTHRHGGAVDLTIVDKKGKELDMGGREIDSTSYLNHFEKKKGISKREKKVRDNRRLLKKVMRKSGFKPYLPEWHHWGYPKK